MKKAFPFLLLAIMSLVVLGGCANSVDEEKQAGREDSAAKAAGTGDDE